MKVILETERLYLREWERSDKKNLAGFLKDEKVMYAYEHGFSDEEVAEWLEWNLRSYAENGYGLWAIVKKQDGLVIGECGLTNQVVSNKKYLEVGYHLSRQNWHQGYGIEAAQACKIYAFEKLKATEVVSIVRDTNLASMNVAIRNGMVARERFIKHYQGIDMPHYLFVCNSI